MRILILIAIGLLLYLIISNYLRKQKVQKPKEKVSAEKMVKCEYCGVHVLEKEALKSQGKYYCCQEHLVASQNKS